MTSTTSQREIVVCPDAAALAEQAAQRIVAASKAAIAQRDRFTLVLSGGSTPERTYQLLAQKDRRSQLDWSRTWIFFGDERCVPLDDPRSNFRMAKQSLLVPLQLDPTHVLAMRTDLGTPAQCAAAYESRLKEFFAGDAAAQFDLILLGLGDDGHTASLFPGKPALQENKAWITWSPPGVLPPPVDRVTFTFPLLNAAREVMFLVSGAGKSATVREILEGNAQVEKHPAVGIQPASGKMIWMLDEPAAKLLTQR